MIADRSTRSGIFASKPKQDFCVPDAHGYCPTCADEALPAILRRVRAGDDTALAELNGQLIEIDVSLIEHACAGQVVLVHGGVAIGLLGAEERR